MSQDTTQSDATHPVIIKGIDIPEIEKRVMYKQLS